MKEFTNLARTIAESAVGVPSDIVDVTRRAIIARKRCASWFQKRAGGNHDRNTKHSHFIDVLEETLALLGVSGEQNANAQGSNTGVPQRTESTSSSETGTPPGNLAIRFPSLEVEESLTTDNNLTRTGQKQPAKRYEVDEQFEDGTGDGIFASFCLFEDMARVRDFLQTTWAEYRLARIDLMAASVTTNTAFDLVRQACEDFMKLYPSLSGNMVLPQMMYDTACLMRSESPAMKYHPQDPFNMAVADVAEWCLFPTVQLLEAFTRVIQPGNVPRYKKDHFGKVDTTKSRDSMSLRERYNQDRNILLGFLPDFVLLTELKIALPVEDEFTRGLRDMVKSKQVPVWLAFAAQILLDIHHTLDVNVAQPFHELRLTGLRTKKTLEEASVLAKSIPSRNWPTQDEDIRQMNDIIDRSISYDVFAVALDRPKEEEFSFLKNHPILCGLTMFSINLRMQQIGIGLVNAWGSVMHLAYLYNLIQQQGHVSLRWPDMDKILEFHDENYIFIGGKPKDLDDSYKKLCLVTGFAPESFAVKGRKGLKNVTSKSGPRLLKSTSVVSLVFLDRYCGDGPIDLSVHNVGRLLEDLVGDDMVTNKRSRKGEALMRRKWKTSHTLSQLQLLTALRERLADEESRLLFNYFGMNSRCIKLLRELRIELDEKFVQYFGPKYLDDESQLTFIVGFIFNVAIGSAASARSLGLPKSAQAASKAVIRAANVMQEFTKKKGDVGCKELRVFCKRKGEVSLEDSKVEEEKMVYWFALDEIVDPKVLAAFQFGGFDYGSSLL